MNFDEWFGARLPALVRFTTVLCGGPDPAEEVLQDVAVKAHKRWDSLRDLEYPEAYLRRMIVNEHLSWRRKWSRLIPYAELADRTAPESGFDDRHAERSALVDELNKLPRRQKAVLVLRYFEGLPDEQIAEILGCARATVRTHAARGLAAMRVELTESSPLSATSGRDHHAH